MTRDPDFLAGKRIRLVYMGEDPDPLEPGVTGTVTSSCYVFDALHVNVDWDHGRGLNLVVPPDRYEVLNVPVDDQ